MRDQFVGIDLNTIVGVWYVSDKILVKAWGFIHIDSKHRCKNLRNPWHSFKLTFFSVPASKLSCFNGRITMSIRFLQVLTTCCSVDYLI